MTTQSITTTKPESKTTKTGTTEMNSKVTRTRSIPKIIGGALLTLFVVLGIVILASYWRFNRKVAREVDALFAAQPPAAETIVTEAMLTPLPAPMQRYLRYAGVVGKPMIHTVRLKQAGRFRTGPDQPWLDFTAEQYYTVDTPGFVWNTTMRSNGIPFLIGRDLYQNATGNMFITIAALIPVADGRGPEIDQGTMLRYLNEMMWFPTAYLHDNVRFTPVDDNTVQVTFTDHGKSVSATLTIDDEGKLTNFIADRYYGGSDTLYPWHTPMTEYGELGGLQLPTRGKGVWQLPAGEFDYIDPEITQLEYNIGKRF